MESRPGRLDCILEEAVLGAKLVQKSPFQMQGSGGGDPEPKGVEPRGDLTNVHQPIKKTGAVMVKMRHRVPGGGEGS